MKKISEETKDQILRSLWVIVIGLAIVYVPYGAGRLADLLIGPFTERFFFAHWVHGFALAGFSLVAIAALIKITGRVYRFIRYGD